jgi:ABC-2 type transport system ATP-binding protein
MDEAACALRFTDVRKRFGASEALRGLTLEVPRGALFGLVGPNGAGKTTAFSIACGFLTPDAGEVSVLGMGRFDPARLKGRMTALPQDAALGRETRCLEHLVFYGRLQGLSAAEATREGERLLDEVGLTDRRRARARTLSHGMLRRLTVAQALIGSPALVLLDEPTSGLDPRHGHELRELLRRTHRQGRTLVISSHNLPELEALCDEVAFIDRGVVAAAGRIDALTGKGQLVEIDLAAGPVPLQAVISALPADLVTFDQDRRVLQVLFQPSAERPGRAAEDVIGLALRALLDGGARVSGVRRGTTLERKFLEMT